MKSFIGLMVMVFLFTLSACNVKEGAKSVGKTIDDTINRENIKKDEK